jgi:HK97 family phage portal protein
MGLLETLGLRATNTASESSTPKITAQYAPAVMDTTYGYGYFNTGSASLGIGAINRDAAMMVPAVSRCRNLIAGVIGSLDLELYRKSTGEEIGKPVWLDQPDYRQPRSVTIAWTVDSLMFYNLAYWRIVEQYADDGRGSRYEWIANNRVTFTTNKYGTEIEEYFVDGIRAPMSGLGSLITFQGLNGAGILQAGARTIQAALDLEKAASVSAATPMPSGYIKNTGADLPEQQISGLLASWKAARLNRSTAYLTSTLSYEPTSFSPKEMMYNEAQQFLTTQVCRLFGVPAWMLSADMNNSMTYQNILDSRKEFLAYTLQPYISAIENRLSLNDMTTSTNVVRFAVDDTFLRADAMTRLAIIEKMLALGLIDLDDAKEMEDLTPEGRESDDSMEMPEDDEEQVLSPGNELGE